MSLIGGIASGIGSVAQGYMGYKATQDTNKTNRLIAKEAQDYEYKMWELENAYNTPESQMRRYKDAGLNPALMYGQGNSGNAGNSPKAHMAQYNSPLSSVQLPNLLSILNQYQDNRIKKAQEMLIQKQITNTDYRSRTELEKGDIARYSADMKAWENRRHLSNLDYLERELQGKSDKVHYDALRSKLDYEAQLKLKPYGSQLSDKLWERTLMQLWHEFKTNVKPKI